MNFFLWKRRRDKDLDAEIRQHLDEVIRDRIARAAKRPTKRAPMCCANSAM